jgi:hypothetical protein
VLATTEEDGGLGERGVREDDKEVAGGGGWWNCVGVCAVMWFCFCLGRRKQRMKSIRRPRRRYGSVLCCACRARAWNRMRSWWKKGLGKVKEKGLLEGGGEGIFFIKKKGFTNLVKIVRIRLTVACATRLA